VSSSAWVNVATYCDRLSAEAMLGLLHREGVPAYIRSDEHVPGLGLNFSISVPPDVERRARRLLEETRVSESELTHLAIGDAGDDRAGE